jgi:RHS repeat-associated protein
LPGWSRSYVYLGARLLSTLTPNGGGGEIVQYHHPDRLGTRVVSNPANGTSFEQVTMPFGAAFASESTGSTNRRFTSYDRSAVTGLDYASNRHYDSQQGRFTQVDPLGIAAANLVDPQTLNMYLYCANDPVNHTDPSGLFFKKLFGFLAKLFKLIAVVVTVAMVVLMIASGFGVPGAAAILKGLNSILGVIGGFMNKVTGGLLAKVTGVINGTLGKVLNGALSKVLGLPFAEGGLVVTKGAMGLTALQIAGNVGAIASHFTQRKDVKKQERFESVQAAAIAALRAINARSIREDREYAGRICENGDGSYIYTKPIKGTQEDSDPGDCPDGTTLAGSYHTHGRATSPGDYETFSGGDITASNIDNVPEYLGTPSGRIRVFDPAVGANPADAPTAGVFLPQRTPVPRRPRKP